MVDITPLIGKGRQLITGYGGGGFKINQEPVEGAVLIFTDEVKALGDIQTLTADHAKLVLDKEPSVELLLIGTGKQIQYIPDEIRQLIRASNIAMEIMDTGAACRTYNVLLTEERRVAALLIAV
ncbi:MAG: Mth938-like domain-containing protein [Rickettsiales bacterium]|nr:Mth938-like domain-containing protein [Rickettsiales bacterium]